MSIAPDQRHFVSLACRRTLSAAMVASLTLAATCAALAAADAPPAPAARVAAQRQLLEQSAQAEAEARKLDGDAEARRAKLRQITGRANVGGLGVAIESLEAERLRLEVDKVGLSARRNALADAIAQVTEVTAKRADAIDADILRELEKQVKLCAEQVERVQKMAAAGQASASDASRAEMELSSARARLDQQRAAPPRATPEFESLAVLNRQLVETAVSLAETVARLEYVVSRLEAMVGADRLVEELTRTSAGAMEAHRKAKDLREQADRLQ